MSPGEPVRLGQVGNFGGVLGPMLAAARTAMAVWAQDVNARGGLACHPVVLYQRDDAADPARSAAVVQELVQRDHVAALVGAFVPLSMPGFASAVSRFRTPVVGGDAMAFEWQSNPYLFLQGAGLAAQIAGILRELVAEQKTKVGLLYCVEATTCATGAKVMEEQSKRVGADLVYSSPVSITQPDYTAACQNAKNAGAQVLGTAMDGASIARVARSCALIDYHPEFAAVGGLLGPAQAQDPAIRSDTLATASVNAPWMLDDTVGQRAYHQALGMWAPGVGTDANSMSAWASGKLLEAVIARLGPTARDHLISTDAILGGLATVRNETLDGLAPALTFIAGRKQEPLVSCVYVEADTPNGWIGPRRSRPVCD
jgi:branched-chain amino acid transport system substrate-binding protein